MSPESPETEPSSLSAAVNLKDPNLTGLKDPSLSGRRGHEEQRGSQNEATGNENPRSCG